MAPVVVVHPLLGRIFINDPTIAREFICGLIKTPPKDATSTDAPGSPQCRGPDSNSPSEYESAFSGPVRSDISNPTGDALGISLPMLPTKPMQPSKPVSHADEFNTSDDGCESKVVDQATSLEYQPFEETPPEDNLTQAGCTVLQLPSHVPEVSGHSLAEHVDFQLSLDEVSESKQPIRSS